MTVALFARVLNNLGEEHKFKFQRDLRSAQEIVQSTLEGILHVVFILILDIVAARLR